MGTPCFISYRFLRDINQTVLYRSDSLVSLTESVRFVSVGDVSNLNRTR